jgi:hypothetical protein
VRAGLVAAALFGCASYVGSDPPTRLPRDATVDEQASDDGANADAPPHTEAAMSDVPARCFWDPGWGCNPYGADPCAPSEGCALTDFDPIAPRAVCRAVGPRPLGALCDETDPSQRCARSFQCLFGRCAATCCGALDDARCAARDPRSACAVPTQSLRVWGCTLPGACDYRADDCPGGQSCFPTGRLGNAVCTVAGEAVDGAPCGAAGVCARGLACVVPFGTTIGRCRRRCNPRDSSRSLCPGRCASFADRPADFGACEGP